MNVQLTAKTNIKHAVYMQIIAINQIITLQTLGRISFLASIHLFNTHRMQQITDNIRAHYKKDTLTMTIVLKA